MDVTQEPPGDSYDTLPIPEMGPEPMLGPLPHDAETMGFAPETVDLLATTGDEDQKALAEDVIRKFERDWKSMEKYRQKRTSIVKLFLGILPPLEDEDGSVGGAQVHYPLVAIAVHRMHSRVYDQQFPASGEFFGCKPLDALDLDRSIRVGKHLNWQISHQIPEYVMNHDVLILQWLLYGSAFSYIYWDPIKNRPCHEVCGTEDIVMPYTHRSTDPSLGDVPRITRILRKHRHELDQLADRGYYGNLDKLEEEDLQSQTSGTEGGGFSASVSQTSGQSMTEVMQKAQGIEPDAKDAVGGEDGPRELLEMHRWWKLPGERRDRAIVATVDRKTKTLIGLRLREDEDPEDRARFNREKAALRASYDAAIAQWSADMAMYNAQAPMPPPMMGGGMADPNAMGVSAGPMPGAGPASMTMPPTPGGPPTMTEMPMPGMGTASGPMAPPPMPPPQPEEPEAPRMIPINFFTHFVCDPNPESTFGFGIGYMLEGMNMVADTIASQIVDAGTLANTKTFFYSRQAKMKRGDLRIKPGEGVEVDLSPADMKGGIMPLEFGPPDAQLAKFIEWQKDWSDELSGANEILSGEVGGSNETATTTQIRISQALAQISIINKRYTRARTFEGKALARLNSVHLEDKEYFSVVDPFKTMPPSVQPGPPMGPPLGGMPGPQGPMGGAPPAAAAPAGPMQMPPGAPPPGGAGDLGPGGPGPSAGPAGPGPVQPPMGPPPPQMPPPGPPQPLIQEFFVGRIDYLEDVDITVTADPRMASQSQRIQEAQACMAAINSSPVTANMIPLQVAGLRKLFTSMDAPDMVAALEQSMAMGFGMMPPPMGGGGGGAPPPGGGGDKAPPPGQENQPFMGQGA